MVYKKNTVVVTAEQVVLASITYLNYLSLLKISKKITDLHLYRRRFSESLSFSPIPTYWWGHAVHGPQNRASLFFRNAVVSKQKRCNVQMHLQPIKKRRWIQLPYHVQLPAWQQLQRLISKMISPRLGPVSTTKIFFCK